VRYRGYSSRAAVLQGPAVLEQLYPCALQRLLQCLSLVTSVRRRPSIHRGPHWLTQRVWVPLALQRFPAGVAAGEALVAVLACALPVQYTQAVLACALPAQYRQANLSAPRLAQRHAGVSCTAARDGLMYNSTRRSHSQRRKAGLVG
jgi:hypothetical protein